MPNKFYAYLDSFDEITLIIPSELYKPDDTYKLVGNDEITDLDIKEYAQLEGEEKVVLSFDAYIRLELVYKVLSSSGLTTELFTGKIIRTPLFDSIYYYYKNDLGVEYTKDSTKFKIWSPIAKAITLELVDKKGNVSYREMVYKNRGLWRHQEMGDVEGYKYRYIVSNNGKKKVCLDPYARSSNANSEYNYVIDESKLYKMKYEVKRPDPLKSVIYEASFRDFSINIGDGDYQSFTKKGLKSTEKRPIGFDHLKELGLTHVQLMPFFAFGGVDELKRDDRYNWGYNPVEYNVPSGYYSTNPNDPYQRLNELRKTIDEIHKAGLNVVMDVVYNHVYDASIFPFETLCPGYAYQYTRDGMLTNSSGCKNDVNSSMRMVRKFIEDSIIYWHKNFKIDGFRVDLMGLIDLDTINSIAMDLESIDPNILLYGEGWKMVYSNAADSLAHMFNKAVVNSVGFFNDRFRETVKGYASLTNVDTTTVRVVLLGSMKDKFLFKYAHQSINYVECHDDMTLYDAIRKLNPRLTDKEARKRSLLATTMTILSCGIPFIHSGQELYGTKNFISNSYISGDKVNSIKWNDVDKYYDDIDFIKKAIKLRKESDEFLLDTKTDMQYLVFTEATELNSILISYEVNDHMKIIFKTVEDLEVFDSLDKYEVILSNLDHKLDNGKLSVKGIGTIVLKEKTK